jgi:hypothetical protein
MRTIINNCAQAAKANEDLAARAVALEASVTEVQELKRRLAAVTAQSEAALQEAGSHSSRSAEHAAELKEATVREAAVLARATQLEVRIVKYT